MKLDEYQVVVHALATELVGALVEVRRLRGRVDELLGSNTALVEQNLALRRELIAAGIALPP